jgi:hypothetical protein
MRVLSSELSMWAEHKQATATSRSERLEVWVGQRPNARQAQPEPTLKAAVVVEPTAEPETKDAVVQRDLLNLAILLRTLGATAKEAQETIARLGAAQQGNPAPAPQAHEPAVASSPTPEAQGWGVAYDMSEQTVSIETSTFRASGQVVTADGRTLDFTTQLSQQRIDVQTSSASLRAGDAAKQVDPLVLNLDNAPVAFSGTHTVDVNADGVAETVARLDAGHAYLALDRNGNGTVDDGSELFGPATGNGFGELQAQDSDGNGWIDEGDAAYSQLRLWSPANDALTGLVEAGVGAIALQNVSTPFSVTAAGQTQGTVARTGVYLREDGGVGTVQHVDLTV